MTVGLRNPGILPEKKGLLLVSNPLCFVFLGMVAGARFERATFGL